MQVAENGPLRNCFVCYGYYIYCSQMFLFRLTVKTRLMAGHQGHRRPLRRDRGEDALQRAIRRTGVCAPYNQRHVAHVPLWWRHHTDHLAQDEAVPHNRRDSIPRLRVVGRHSGVSIGLDLDDAVWRREGIPMQADGSRQGHSSIDAAKDSTSIAQHHIDESAKSSSGSGNRVRGR